MSAESEEELEALVQPPEPQDLSIPEPLSFAPWHKPRKQYVRREQWIRHIQGVIEKLKQNGDLNGDRPFRYLTLPGPDLLDVKLVADLCVSYDERLHYLGFCHTDEKNSLRLRRNVNEFGIARSKDIAPSSGVVLAPLQDVQRKTSKAFVSMTKSGTFDAVNIDACDPIAKDDQDATGRLIDSIRRVTDYQIANRRSPWVLFLTTPVQIDTISNESLGVLLSQIEQNSQNDEQFAQEIGTQFADGEDLAAFMRRWSRQNGSELLSLVTLGLAKWFIHLSEQVHFRVKLMKSYNYSIFQEEPFEPNMLSLCFLFEPSPPQIIDDTGLTVNQDPNPVGTPPISDHIRALRKSISIENVDELLADDEGLRVAMIEDTKAMLQTSGYQVNDPVNGYDAWLSGFE